MSARRGGGAIRGWSRLGATVLAAVLGCATGDAPAGDAPAPPAAPAGEAPAPPAAPAGEAPIAPAPSPLLVVSDRAPLGCCCVTHEAAQGAKPGCVYGLSADKCREAGRIAPTWSSSWRPGKCAGS